MSELDWRNATPDRGGNPEWPPKWWPWLRGALAWVGVAAIAWMIWRLL